jgi:solute carrier family 38 (sodium-coupled neutral amino acid transporter), member 11
LLVVFAAFFISPTSECLGPILELNVISFSDSAFVISNLKSNPLLFALEKNSQGLLSAIPLSYIIPGLIFLKLDPHALFSREKLPAIALVAFGLIVSISGKRIFLQLLKFQIPSQWQMVNEKM